MKKVLPLPHQLLCKRLNPKQLGFKSTAELEPLTDFIGQERALHAIYFGIGIKSKGYNIYAMGPSGIGKRSLVSSVLMKQAKEEKSPPDWCYLYNFKIPEKPIPVQLPAGMGSILLADMKEFIQSFSVGIVAVFESDEYNESMQKINKEFNKTRYRAGKKTKKITTSKVPKFYKERHEKELALQLKFASSVIDPGLQKLKAKYKKFPEVTNYFNEMKLDILKNINELIHVDEKTNVVSFISDNPNLVNYQINLLVDNSKTEGAPVIFEDHPSYSNLICKVEHISQHGNLVTNFTLIRPGSLHKANGGYLIIEAKKIKNEPHSWEGLKRALYSHQIVIEPVENFTETIRPISLEPIPIPLNIKVILLGNRNNYYKLINKDSDFNELFKVSADFDEEIARNANNIRLYARLIGTITKTENLRPFNAAAVAALIDYSTRIAEDIEKLTTHIRSIDDLVVESDYWAGEKNKKIVDETDVQAAIDAQIYRKDRSRQLYYEEILRNFIIIYTEKKLIGQINCLSVVKVGKFSYGHPTRVTAKVRMGNGKIIDIQREIHLAGPIHTKGNLILSNFLLGRYNPEHSVSISASISFEQIYGMMEGDSASVGEVCALLSAIANIPIKQYLAVTGSIDQYGEVQVVGGINHKIEGFFDVCKAKGLNGKQGVLIPAVNVENLMLRKDVVQAAKEKQFFIYPISTVDEAIHILTGMIPGSRDKNGIYPTDSFNYQVEMRLKQFTKNFFLEKSSATKLLIK